MTMFLGIGQSQAQDANLFACPNKQEYFYVIASENSVYDWDVEGGEIVREELRGDTLGVYIQWDESGTYDLDIFEHSQYGCYGDYHVEVEIFSVPSFNGLEDAEVCEGDLHEFTVNNEFDAYVWSGDSNDNTLIASEEGYYWVEALKSFEIDDEVHTCWFRDSAYLTVQVLPEIDLGPDTMLCGKESYLLAANSSFDEILWSTGAITNNIFITDDFAGQTISVTGTNYYGSNLVCSTSDEMMVIECTDADFLEIPTVFTPNGDGIHDTWYIDYLMYYPEVSVEVFDRWGNKVFSSIGYNDPWDGTNKGRELPMDSYYFIIDLNNGYEPFTGSVTIIR